MGSARLAYRTLGVSGRPAHGQPQRQNSRAPGWGLSSGSARMDLCRVYSRVIAAETRLQEGFVVRSMGHLIGGTHFRGDTSLKIARAPGGTQSRSAGRSDGLFDNKATFEAFIGIRDDDAARKLLFSQRLQDLLPGLDEKSIFVSFLAGCFRSIRFGLAEANGKGEDLILSYVHEKGGYVYHSDGIFSVNFDKVRGAVEELNKEILTIETQGNKPRATKVAIDVPVDIAPTFEMLNSPIYLQAGIHMLD
ncbi:hypothetical protein R1flu_001545 [Riccia fluitans]|uniref:Uncharacterized protein n=1 Tax=Riccia fluitans TaxID=41844 RepID=A0ABD1Y3R1_9MARC